MLAAAEHIAVRCNTQALLLSPRRGALYADAKSQQLGGAQEVLRMLSNQHIGPGAPADLRDAHVFQSI